MKFKVFQIIVLIITIAFGLSTAYGEGKAESTQGRSSAAEQEGPVTLKMFIRERWPGVSYDNFSTHYIEDKTNTKWDLTIASSQLEEKLNVTLASGETFDVIQYGSNSMELKLVKAGVMYPINESFATCPNLAMWGDKGIWEAMKYPDGNIYSIPIKGDPYLDFLPIYRKDWLDKLGLKIPQTLEEYYNVAVSISTEDPDGNGKKDTYAFGSYGVKDMRNFDHIFAAFGVLPSYWIDVDGHLMNSAVAPGAKDALKFLNKMYEAGTIDLEFVTDSESRYKTKFISGIYGATCYKIYLFDTNNLYDYHDPFFANNPDAELVTGPILKGGSENPLGMRKLTQRGWLKSGIMKNSENIDAVLRVFDWLTSDEGVMFVNYGIENEDYTLENGVVNQLIDDEQIKQRGITQCYLAMNFLIKQTSVELQKMNEYVKTIATADLGDGILVDEEKYTEDLNNYRASQYAKMIVGELPVDTGFSAFVDEWNKRGGEALTESMDKVYQQRKAKQ